VVPRYFTSSHLCRNTAARMESTGQCSLCALLFRPVPLVCLPIPLQPDYIITGDPIALAVCIVCHLIELIEIILWSSSFCLPAACMIWRSYRGEGFGLLPYLYVKTIYITKFFYIVGKAGRIHASETTQGESEVSTSAYKTNLPCLVLAIKSRLHTPFRFHSIVFYLVEPQVNIHHACLTLPPQAFELQTGCASRSGLLPEYTWESMGTIQVKGKVGAYQGPWLFDKASITGCSPEVYFASGKVHGGLPRPAQAIPQPESLAPAKYFCSSRPAVARGQERVCGAAENLLNTFLKQGRGVLGQGQATHGLAWNSACVSSKFRP